MSIVATTPLSWEDQYRFRWDALEATIQYYSTHMEEWD